MLSLIHGRSFIRSAFVCGFDSCCYLIGTFCLIQRLVFVVERDGGHAAEREEGKGGKGGWVREVKKGIKEGNEYDI